MRILVVEDDAKVANAVRTGLSGEGYEVVVSRTGEDGYFRATTEPFDAVLLGSGLARQKWTGDPTRTSGSWGSRTASEQS